MLICQIDTQGQQPPSRLEIIKISEQKRWFTTIKKRKTKKQNAVRREIKNGRKRGRPDIFIHAFIFLFLFPCDLPENERKRHIASYDGLRSHDEDDFARNSSISYPVHTHLFLFMHV